MDIGFTEEQELLRDTARKFLDSECDTKFVRAMMATEAAVTPEFWDKLAENGWLGIAFPEEYGGSGLGLVDLVVLMEEVGRAVMPGPFPGDGAARRRGDRRGGVALAAPGIPAGDRRGRSQGDARRDRAQRALGCRRHHPGGTRGARRVHPLRHQAVRARRPSGRRAGGRGAHQRRQHDGGRGQPLPRAQGDRRGHGPGAALGRRDAQIVRGHIRQCHGAGNGAPRRPQRRLAGPGAGHRPRRGGARRPRCAARPSGSST